MVACTLAIDAGDGAHADSRGGMGCEGTTLKEVVSEGVRASAEWADGHGGFGGAMGGGAAEGPIVFTLL